MESADGKKPVKRERVMLNIAGDIYETYKCTLQRFPETLLGDDESIEKYFVKTMDQYFFDRNRACFGAILFYYQSFGTLRCPPDTKISTFEVECQFFGIPQDTIEDMKLREGILPDSVLTDTMPQDALSIKVQIWNFMDAPQTSVEAHWFALISFGLICISIITVCLETVPELKHATTFATNPWAIVELLLNSWFLVELLVRFTFAPSKKKFLHDSLNWIDAFAVIPYFFTPFFSNVKVKSLGFLRILKFVRIMRLFRLSKHSKRLKVVAAIIKSSVPGFQLLLMCLAIVVILGGAIMYFIEEAGGAELGTPYESIPESLWWAVQALTTVGYGDIVPVTIGGKLFAALYMTFGALTVCLSVLPIVSKFLLFYEKNIANETTEIKEKDKDEDADVEKVVRYVHDM